MRDYVKLTEHDNVAVVTHDVPKGTEIIPGIITLNDIPQAHKFALVDIPKDGEIIRYGVVLGYALDEIKNAGADIGMVQIGNETNGGIAGEYSKNNMAEIYKAASSATRNFDKNIKKSFAGGSTGEELLVNSVVKTLTEFPEVKQVCFLIDGKEIETLSGHMDLSEPIKKSDL